MTKKLTPQQKLNRKPISRACNLCHQKHLQCDSGRPCKNCLKRNLHHSCRDIQRKRAKYLTLSGRSSLSSPQDSDDMDDDLPIEDRSSINIPAPSENDSNQISSMPSSTADDIAMSLANMTDLSHLNMELSDSTNFHSNFINQEYLMLGDILSSKPTSPMQSDNESRPFIQLSTTATTSQPNQYSAIKDEPDYTPPLIVRHIYQSIQDIYTKPIQAYNYPSGYHALTRYLKKRFNQKQLLIVIRYMASYRPTFIAATRSLINTDLIYLEQTFQRSLMDYELLSSLNSSPTIIWRRTGEIVNITPEFSSLTGYSYFEVLSKRTFIFELLDDDSILNYFRLFNNIAIGNLNSNINTNVKLVLKNDNYMKCCCVWTIKRDIFDLPMLIVGQFLPILE